MSHDDHPLPPDVQLADTLLRSKESDEALRLTRRLARCGGRLLHRRPLRGQGHVPAISGTVRPRPKDTHRGLPALAVLAASPLALGFTRSHTGVEYMQAMLERAEDSGWIPSPNQTRAILNG